MPETAKSNCKVLPFPKKLTGFPLSNFPLYPKTALFGRKIIPDMTLDGDDPSINNGVSLAFALDYEWVNLSLEKQASGNKISEENLPYEGVTGQIRTTDDLGQIFIHPDLVKNYPEGDFRGLPFFDPESNCHIIDYMKHRGLDAELIDDPTEEDIERTVLSRNSKNTQHRQMTWGLWTFFGVVDVPKMFSGYALERLLDAFAHKKNKN